MQQVVVYGLVVAAVLYMAWRVFKRKKKDDCGPDCNCK